MEDNIRSALAAARTRLSDSDSALRDAEILLCHVLACTRAHLFAFPEQALLAQQAALFEQLLVSRQDGVPIAYLTGQREFWSLPLIVTRDTLIPRPETELLVELALARLPVDRDLAVADLGTGSGAIALAIARERQRCRIIATDSSAAALTVAESNAVALGLRRVQFRPGDWLAPLAGEQFDLIVSNPPYIRADDEHLTEGDVRFEPRAALVSGADGLDAIRAIIDAAPDHLLHNGALLLEHGFEQGPAVRDLLRARGYAAVFSERDLENRERVSGGRFRKR